MEASIAKRGMGSFTLPGLMKITTLRRPAVKARKGINPFTGEETWFKAKPARTQVKIRPLKKLKGGLPIEQVARGPTGPVLVKDWHRQKVAAGCRSVPS